MTTDYTPIPLPQPKDGKGMDLGDGRLVSVFPLDDGSGYLLQFIRKAGDREIITRVSVSNEAAWAVAALILGYSKAQTEIALAVDPRPDTREGEAGEQ